MKLKRIRLVSFLAHSLDVEIYECPPPQKIIFFSSTRFSSPFLQTKMLRDVAFRAAALARAWSRSSSLTGSAASAASGQQVRTESERGRQVGFGDACVLVGAFFYFSELFDIFLPRPSSTPPSAIASRHSTRPCHLIASLG